MYCRVSQGHFLPQILHIGSSKLAGSPFSLGWKPKCSQTGDVTLGFGTRAPAIISAFKINETPDTNSSWENDTRNTLVSLLIYLTFNAQWWIVKQEGHSLMEKKKKKKKLRLPRFLRFLSFLCGWLVNSAVLQYCGYRDSPNVPFTVQEILTLWTSDRSHPQLQCQFIV